MSVFIFNKKEKKSYSWESSDLDQCNSDKNDPRFYATIIKILVRDKLLVFKFFLFSVSFILTSNIMKINIFSFSKNILEWLINDTIILKNNTFQLKRKILCLDLSGCLSVLSRGMSSLTELYDSSTFMTDNCALEFMILLPVNLCLFIHYKILWSCHIICI